MPELGHVRQYEILVDKFIPNYFSTVAMPAGIGMNPVVGDIWHGL